MTTNPQSDIKSWIENSEDSDFSIHNFPFGIFSRPNSSPKAASAIGEYIIDLNALLEEGFFKSIELPDDIFKRDALNDFIALGKPITNAVRARLIDLFSQSNDELKNNQEARAKCLIAHDNVRMHMPVRVGDYTDFYSSEQHAYNVGCMFRDPDNALLHNWKHIPVGYHGRASSIVISGTDIHRPKGQQLPQDADSPVFGPCKLLDFELEMAFVTGKATSLSDSVAVSQAEDHIFGMVLFNDWSARDIQKWEYVPLGPFLAKNFASSVSPWIVTMEALAPFKVDGPEQEPEVLPYLKDVTKRNYDIDLEVSIQPEKGDPHTVTRSNFKYMYWSMAQQLAHHTVNGCNINVGDMYASGTISGPTPDSYGSMLELAWKGTKPIKMPDGTERKFILDGDTVTMKGRAQKNGIRVGFGEVTNKILPSK